MLLPRGGAWGSAWPLDNRAKVMGEVGSEGYLGGFVGLIWSRLTVASCRKTVFTGLTLPFPLYCSFSVTLQGQHFPISPEGTSQQQEWTMWYSFPKIHWPACLVLIPTFVFQTFIFISLLESFLNISRVLLFQLVQKQIHKLLHELGHIQASSTLSMVIVRSSCHAWHPPLLFFPQQVNCYFNYLLILSVTFTSFCFPPFSSSGLDRCRKLLQFPYVLRQNRKIGKIIGTWEESMRMVWLACLENELKHLTLPEKTIYVIKKQ